MFHAAMSRSIMAINSVAHKIHITLTYYLIFENNNYIFSPEQLILKALKYNLPILRGEKHFILLLPKQLITRNVHSE